MKINQFKKLLLEVQIGFILTSVYYYPDEGYVYREDNKKLYEKYTLVKELVNYRNNTKYSMHSLILEKAMIFIKSNKIKHIKEFDKCPELLTLFRLAVL